MSVRPQEAAKLPQAAAPRRNIVPSGAIIRRSRCFWLYPIMLFAQQTLTQLCFPTARHLVVRFCPHAHEIKLLPWTTHLARTWNQGSKDSRTRWFEAVARFQGSEVPRLDGSSVLGLQGSRNPGLFFAVGITNARQTTTLQYKKHQIRFGWFICYPGESTRFPGP